MIFNASQFRFGRQAQCRALLAQGRLEGWHALADQHAFEILREIEDLLSRSRKGLVIDLVGGIGDQLQMTSLIMALNSHDFFQGRLWLRPGGPNARLVEDWLELTRASEHLVWPEDQIVGFCSSPFFRILLSGMNEVLEYQTLSVETNWQIDGASGTQILCCWRTKPDRLNPFTSFSRSLPLRTIFSLLEQWQPALKDRRIRLMDLSEYTKEEQELLQERFPFVQFVRRDIRSLSDSYELIGQCDILFQWIRRSLILRLHLVGKCICCYLCFPMSAGLSYSRFLVYKDWVIPHRQTCFNDWDAPLRSVAEILGLVVA